MRRLSAVLFTGKSKSWSDLLKSLFPLPLSRSLLPPIWFVLRAAHPEASETVFRGPVNLVLSSQQDWAATANQLSGTVSLIDLNQKRTIDELTCGAKATDICILDNNQIIVSCQDSGDVVRLEVKDQQLKLVDRIHVGLLPHGLAAAKSGSSKVFVSLVATGEIAELDFEQGKVVRKFSAGHWPRFITLSKDGTRLAVGLGGESAIAVFDVAKGEELYREPLSGGINLGHMRSSSDGINVYFPWMIYRTNPIDVRNIRLGWVLASRAARVRFDGPAYREALSLDVPGMAVADPFGIALTPNEHRMTISSSGTHELLVYRLADLPFVGSGGPGDLIDRKLLRDKDLFYRIEVGGRPMGLQPLGDNRRILVANHTLDCIQIVDIESQKLESTISLGKVPDNSETHRGMEIFYDARRSLDQWYSCQSCHLDGGSNAKAMDTWNDGTALTAKTVLPLFGVADTAPWTWHGWQNDLDDSIQTSFSETMQGKNARPSEVADVRAYITSLTLPPNPFLGPDGALGELAERGKRVFESKEAACANCHVAPTYSDGNTHDVGLGSESDKYKGHNTPSLLGLYRRVRFLHDGRAKTLESVLKDHHGPDVVSGGVKLTDQQVEELVAYLKTL